MMVQRGANDLVQLGCANTIKRLLVQHLRVIQHFFDVASVLSRNERNRGIP